MSKALCPLDGRYRDSLGEIRELGFSESCLIGHKFVVEASWLVKLAQVGLIPSMAQPDITQMQLHLESIFNEKIVARVVDLDRQINHDTKAIEIVLRRELENTPFAHASRYVHFGLTSEDVSNAAYGLMIASVWDKALAPFARKISAVLTELIHNHAESPMLSMTHGQPASPTTYGKELAVFQSRLMSCQFGKPLDPGSFPVKFSGAVGAMNALQFAAPEFEWRKICELFVEELSPKFHFSSVSTQVANREELVALLQRLGRMNSVLIDLARDHWQYISRNIVKAKVVRDEVGSSTMPHKVNPIQFENAEGNLEMANSIIQFLSSKLLCSRMQRDLSDSCVMRNLGLVFGYSLVGWKSCYSGLQRTSFDDVMADAELDAHWEVLAEAVQTLLRRYPAGEDPFEMMRSMTRSSGMTKAEYSDLIETKLNGLVTPDDLERLRALSPKTYTGLAKQFALRASAEKRP